MQDSLTPAEWIVMAALWERSPMTLSEVIRQIGDRANWNYKTYASYLAILLRKGFIGAETRYRDKLYYPVVTRERCIEAESKSILGKIEKSAVKELLVSMVREGGLSADDRKELLTMLETLQTQEGAQ